MHNRSVAAGHLNVLALASIRTMWPIVGPLASKLLLIKVDIILFDMNNGLPEQSICFADECRGDLETE